MSTPEQGQVSLLEKRHGRRFFVPKKLLMVNSDFQIRYIRVSVFIGFISTLVTAFTILYPLYTFEFLRIPKSVPSPIVWGVCIAILCNIFSISFVALLISHKIAGPMYAIVRRLHGAVRGKWQGKLQVRKSDELNYIVRNVNHFFDYLVRITSEEIKELQEIRAELKSTNHGLDTSRIDSLLKRMQERIASKYD